MNIRLFLNLIGRNFEQIVFCPFTNQKILNHQCAAGGDQAGGGHDTVSMRFRNGLIDPARKA